MSSLLGVFAAVSPWIFPGNIRRAAIAALEFGIVASSALNLIETDTRAFRREALCGRAGFRRRHVTVPVTSTSGTAAKILRPAIAVDPAIFFATLTTVATFIPLFTCQGVGGRIFSPMARTYGHALVLPVTGVPIRAGI